MLEYDRIDLNEGIDVTKNKLISKVCWLCNHWYFINKNFNYQKKYVLMVVMTCL